MNLAEKIVASQPINVQLPEVHIKSKGSTGNLVGRFFLE